MTTAQAMGWAGLRNGELLRHAADAGFDAVLTVDKGFEFQQNLSTLPLAVVILRARSNRMDDLEPLVPHVLRRLDDLEPGRLIRVGD